MNESFSYGRKVFLGGLPMAVTVAELHANFDRFGPLMVDWPHKASYEVMPPNRYAFLIFSNPASVNFLMSLCGPSDFNNFIIDLNNGNKVIISVKPWELRNNEAVLDRNWQRFERFSIFIGGVHRRATANELANLINEAIGGVVYVGMEIDEQTDYPKGAARVVFSNPASYIKAIGTRRITTMTNGYERVIELKPYVCDNMRCEECLVAEARFFCPEIRCLKYFCEMCWPMSHVQPGLGAHIPMDKNNLHLHTPKKHMQRVDKAYPNWIPLTPCSSLSSPLKLSPTLSDLKLDELKIFDALYPTSPSKINIQFNTPKKFMPRGDKAFTGRIPLTPNSNMASPLKLIPTAFEFGPFKPEI